MLCVLNAIKYIHRWVLILGKCGALDILYCKM